MLSSSHGTWKKIQTRSNILVLYVLGSINASSTPNEQFFEIKVFFIHSSFLKETAIRHFTAFYEKRNHKTTIHTPKNIFLPESKPAANIRAVYGGSRSTRIRQANREIVDCVTTLFLLRWSPGMVSMTTKSIGDSDERPIWNISLSLTLSYCTMTAWLRFNV